MIHPLESRCHLSATISSAGQLTIVGTGKNDRISVRYDGTSYLVNDGRRTSSFSQNVSSIRIDAGNGRDVVNVDESVGIGALINGGAGNDTLSGGRGDDTLVGGAGNDVMSGNDGWDTVSYAYSRVAVTASIDGLADSGARGESDMIGTDVEVLVGGSGNDRLIGTPNSDELHGGRGNDSLEGDAGLDNLFGDAGNDTLVAGAGHQDSLYGGDGNDRLEAGNGYDSLFGDSGNDTLVGSGSGSRLFGGTGDDTYVIPQTGFDYKYEW